MVVLIESVVGIFLFTIIIVLVTLKDPIASVGDYPPAIRKNAWNWDLWKNGRSVSPKGILCERPQRCWCLSQRFHGF